jgi:TDG/mug DNA glycosylase family protein
MLPEILAPNLNVVFVGTTVGETSDELGFYYLGQNNKFWFLLEYAGITPKPVISAGERKVLVNAKKGGVLSDAYKQLFFEKKESALLRDRIGLTDLNRRRVISNDDDPAAAPTADDLQKFVAKVKKYRPKVLAFVTSLDIFEKCWRPLYPSATRQRGKQDFVIGDSEIWLLGSTSGRGQDTDALEQVFEDLAHHLKQLESSAPEN